MEETSPSLRDTVKAAVVEHTEQAPVADSPPVSTPEPSAPSGDGGSEPGYLEPKPSEPPVDRGDGRDAAGKFAPKKDAQAELELPGTTKPPVEVPEAPKPPIAAPEPSREAKAPSSWKPAVREHWTKLPPEVQGEIHRREQDMQRFMGETKPIYQFAQHFSAALQPFASDIQAVAGGDIVAFSAENAKVRHRIFHGGREEKAEVLAGLIAQSGVDLELLDAVLGKRIQSGPQAQAPQPQQPIDPQAIQQNVIQQIRQEFLNEKAQAEVKELETSGKFEFFEDLRDDMADIMELNAKRNRTQTMEEVYHRAAALHPEVSKAIAKRAEEKRSQTAAAAAAQARRTAVSLPSGGAPQGSPGGNGKADLRSTVAAAMREANRKAQ